jgi:hypothetical protein
MPDCGDLNVPKPPEFDVSKVPAGLKMPPGMSVDDLKKKAENPGLSGRLKNAGAAIGANIRNFASQLNPAAIADRVAGAVTDMVGDIKAGISHMADGLTSLKDKITGFDPAEKLKGLSPKSPKGMFENMKNKAKGQLDGMGGKLKGMEINCEKAGLGAAGKVNTIAQSSGKEALAGLSNKDRIAMAKDSTVKDAKITEAAASASTNTTEKITQEATSEDKSEKSVQEVLHSETIPSRPAGLWALGHDAQDDLERKTAFTMHAVQMIYKSIQLETAGYMCSYHFRNPTGKMLGLSNKEEAANAHQTILIAALVRSLGCVMKALRGQYDAVYDTPPAKDDLMLDTTRDKFSYHEHLMVGSYFPYSHGEPHRIPSSTYAAMKTPWKVIHGRKFQRKYWEFWASADSYVDKYLANTSDLTKTMDRAVQTNERTDAFWIHHNQSSSQPYADTQISKALKGKTPMNNFQNALQTEDILKELHESIRSQKRKLCMVEKEAVSDALSVGIEINAEEDLLICDNLENPGFIVTDIHLPHHPKYVRLFPTRFLIAIHFNYSTYNIDKIEYIGDDEVLKKYIK